MGRQRWWLLAVCAFLLTCGPGCRQKKHRPKYATRVGRVHSIDPETGKVSMECEDPKTGTKFILRGEVNQNTEILINGRTATLEEVRVGEWVKVTGYREGPKTNPRVVATRVEVMREGWPAGTKGTGGQPAKPTPGKANTGRK